MNLEELRETRRTERNRDGLQPLSETFYGDVAAYVADLKAERERAAEAADDPFSAPEVRRLTDEIESAEEIVQSLYERRVGKVVDRASFAAADKRHETEGLTAEERDLFDDLVARIERNRERVLDSLDPSAGAGSAGSPETTAEAARETTADDGEASRVPDGTADAPDPSDLLTEAMGGSRGAADHDADTGDGSTDTAETASAGESPEATDGGTPRDERDPGGGPGTGSAGAPDDATPTPAAPTGDGTAPAAPTGDGTAPSADGSDGTAGSATPAAPVAGPETGSGTASDGSAGGGADRTDPDDGDATRTTVYVTRDVGEIFGVDERTYRLAAEDVVDLPADNARALVERDAAEPLE